MYDVFPIRTAPLTVQHWTGLFISKGGHTTQTHTLAYTFTHELLKYCLSVHSFHAEVDRTVAQQDSVNKQHRGGGEYESAKILNAFRD